MTAHGITRVEALSALADGFLLLACALMVVAAVAYELGREPGDRA